MFSAPVLWKHYMTRKSRLFVLFIAAVLSLGVPAFAQTNGNDLSIMSTALALTGQPNWSFYNGGDAPEGAYIGWLLQAQTLTGTVDLPRQLAPGRYYVFFYGSSFDANETMKALIGGGTSTIVVMNDRDGNQYWSD